MPERIEIWKQSKIEQLAPGETWSEESFVIFRGKDGWNFFWKWLTRGSGPCTDLGRFFNEDHIWEMRNFMSGQWDKGVIIGPPSPADLV